MRDSLRLAALAVWGMLVWSGVGQASPLPPGTTLAPTQHVVRHLKDEPVSLDPVAAVGLTEAQVLRDLFEGLVNQGADGRVQPGVAWSIRKRIHRSPGSPKWRGSPTRRRLLAASYHPIG